MLVLSLFAAAPPAFAQVSTSTQTATSTAAEVAKLYAGAARAYYRAGNYTEALEEFNKAYVIRPTAALSFNIARCHEKLSQWTEAIEIYERYVKEETDPREKAEALDKIEILKKKLGPTATGPDAKYNARISAGRRAYAKGDYEAAIEEFKAAFDMKASTGALFNIAKSYEKMGRYEEAIDYYQQYLDLDPHATDRADIEEVIRRLKKSIKERFQELTVTSDPEGADIYLDDRNTGLQGQTNFRLKVTPGPHTLYLDKNGFEPVKRDFVMPDDKPLVLDFKMKKLENVGHVKIDVNKPGARIFIDGAIIGLSPYKQKKTLQAGSHQIQVELLGYNRWEGSVTVIRDKTEAVKVIMKEYEPPVEDDTLTSWGRNLILIGVIGGTLGVVGPFAYEKLVLRRNRFEQLGPETVSDEAFYRGPLSEEDPDRRTDSEYTTLRGIQTWSLVGASVFTAGGLAFYMYKWFRDKPPAPVTAGLEPGFVPEEEESILSITGFGVTPTEEGGTAVGITGRF